MNISKSKVSESVKIKKSDSIFAAEEDEAPVFDFSANDNSGGSLDTSDFDDFDDEEDNFDEESEDDDGDEFVVEEDDIAIENENNISNHYIAECDVCKGIFISAVVESDQILESINGICPLCNKQSEQFLKWVVKDVE